jgi:hypothetical protein
MSTYQTAASLPAASAERTQIIVSRRGSSRRDDGVAAFQRQSELFRDFIKVVGNNALDSASTPAFCSAPHIVKLLLLLFFRLRAPRRA